MKPDHERVTKLLTDTITLLCKNGLSFEKTLKIQGLIAVTIDSADIVVVQMNDTFTSVDQSVASSETESNNTINNNVINNNVNNNNNNLAARKRPASTDIVDLTRLVETPDIFNLTQISNSRRTDIPRHLRSEVQTMRVPENNRNRLPHMPPKPTNDNRMISRNMSMIHPPPPPLPPEPWPQNTSVNRFRLNFHSQPRHLSSQAPPNVTSQALISLRMHDEMIRNQLMQNINNPDTRFNMQSNVNNSIIDFNNVNNTLNTNRRINPNRCPAPNSMERSAFLDPNQISNILEYERLCGSGTFPPQPLHHYSSSEVITPRHELNCSEDNPYAHQQQTNAHHHHNQQQQQQPDSMTTSPIVCKPRRPSRNRTIEQHINLCNDDDDDAENNTNDDDILRDAILQEIPPSSIIIQPDDVLSESSHQPPPQQLQPSPSQQPPSHPLNQQSQHLILQSTVCESETFSMRIDANQQRVDQMEPEPTTQLSSESTNQQVQ